MTTDQSDNDPSDESARAEGTTSIRVAMVVFMITLLVLGAMAVYWLTIRV